MRQKVLVHIFWQHPQKPDALLMHLEIVEIEVWVPRRKRRAYIKNLRVSIHILDTGMARVECPKGNGIFTTFAAERKGDNCSKKFGLP